MTNPMTLGAWLRGYFAGRDTDEGLGDVITRWLALAAVVIGAVLFVGLSQCLFC